MCTAGAYVSTPLAAFGADLAEVELRQEIETGRALRRGPRSPSFDCWRYLVVVELPEELPLPIEPLELPVLGVLGDVVLGEVVDELPEELLPMPDELPPVAPLDDLLKCASHSEREIDPSLFVSTAEKLGVSELLPLELELGDVLLAEPPAADEPLDDVSLDELPLADDGDEDELPLVADGDDVELLDFLSSAALAARDRAKSAAAVVTVTVLSIG